MWIILILRGAPHAGAKERAEGLLVTAESIFVVHRARVSELATRYRLPAMYPYTIQVAEAGGLPAACCIAFTCNGAIGSARYESTSTREIPAMRSAE